MSPRASLVFAGLLTALMLFRVGAVSPAAAAPERVSGEPDTTAPETVLSYGFGSPTKDRTPTFELKTTEPGVVFECSFEDGPFVACNTPHTLPRLADGSYRFAARAIDPAGNVDETPATTEFEVEATPPETSFTSGPADGASISRSSASFGFASNEAESRFDCKVDDADIWKRCRSPLELTGLADGEHSVEVRATDPVGNVDPTPVRTTFFVDTAEPFTRFLAGPADGSTISSGDTDFSFESNEGGERFECSLDGADFALCRSPLALRDLGEGQHRLAVRALDTAGNADPSPATRRFSVDSTSPETTIRKRPAALVKTRKDHAVVRYGVASNEPEVRFECVVGSRDWQPCGARPSIRLAATRRPSAYTISIRAVDAGGNVDATPATHELEVVRRGRRG